jgi:PHP family Zn ribbon phosphoesterase
MILENIEPWAQLKGLSVIGTGDFTHPLWFKDIKDKLSPAEEGLFKLRSPSSNYVPASCQRPVRFILSAEISSIYSKNNRLRKVHNLILVPTLEAASKINSRLSHIGNLAADGRPILGLDSKDLLEITLEASSEAVFIPAHAWTPHFSIFGSNSGFNSIEECFEELTPHIKAIETGLSSDPAMNWRVKALDKITLVSNSDAHSLEKIGREANIFEGDLTYTHIKKAIEKKDGFKGTI